MLATYKTPLSIFLFVTAIALVYYPGLSGGFVFDDISNILLPTGLRMDALSWDSIKNAALSMDKRPIVRASFGLNYHTTGFDPFYFKAINIAIHIINSLLVYGFVFLLLSAHQRQQNTSEYTSRVIFISTAVALGWALHPVNLTNVLYSVQRMNSLSALFVLAGMISYIKGRIILDDAPGKGWILINASILLFLPLGWFNKENAALLPIFLLVIELTIFRFATTQIRQRNGLYLFYTLFLILPALLIAIYIFQHPSIFHGGYRNRHFSMMERLLTEPRVIWLYIRMILLPSPSLFGLFHDDIPISTSLTEPVSTLFALVGLSGIFVVALASIKKAPILAFGLLFFLAGHLMESTFIPLELAFEHRNYLPSIGLLVLFFYYLGFGIAPGKHIKIRTTVMVAFILLLALQTHFRAWTWSDNIRLYLTEVQYHPNSTRANYEAGKVFGQRLERGQGDPENNYMEAIRYFERVTSLRQNTTSGLFGSILASIDGNQEIRPAWIEKLEYRLGTQPLEQVNLLWLDRLTDCVSQGECQKKDVQIQRLVNSAINNQYANNTNRAMLYTILAKYAHKVEADNSKMLAMADKAVSLNPLNLYYRINLAKYLIFAGEKDKAMKVLEETEKVDTYHQFTLEITRLIKNLEVK